MTNGFDASMMNGLQSLTQWEDDFNHPVGGTLGLLNAIQVRYKYMLAVFMSLPPSEHRFSRCIPVFTVRLGWDRTETNGLLGRYHHEWYVPFAESFALSLIYASILLRIQGATALQTASNSIGMFIGAR